MLARCPKKNIVLQNKRDHLTARLFIHRALWIVDKLVDRFGFYCYNGIKSAFLSAAKIVLNRLLVYKLNFERKLSWPNWMLILFGITR